MSDNIQEDLKNAINAALKKVCNIDKNGQYSIEIYTDYSDKNAIDEKFVNELDNIEQFYEKIDNLYEERVFDAEYFVIKKLIEDDRVIETWGKAFPSDIDTGGIPDKNALREFVVIDNDMFSVKYPPFVSFADIKVCIDVCVDTGDGNYEYTSNLIPPHPDADEDMSIPPKESSIAWLANTQGFSPEQLISEMKADERSDTFLQSVYEEALNSTSDINQLVFLTKVPITEYFKLKEVTDENYYQYKVEDRSDKGYITFNKNTFCGLFDFFQGAGSDLGIQLNKPVTIPFSHIRQITIDTGSYSIHGVCNTDDKAWEAGTIDKIDYENPAPTSLNKENEATLQKNINPLEQAKQAVNTLNFGTNELSSFNKESNQER